MLVAAILLAAFVQAVSPPASTKNAGEEQLALGEAAPAGSAEQRRFFENAVADYRRAEADSGTAIGKAEALDKLATLYDTRHLNEPAEAEMVLRELVAVASDDLTVLFRLSRVQESQGELDAAEATLLYARRAQPMEIEPNRMLTQFYVRRVVESSATTPQMLAPPAPAPAAPDRDGFYHVGSSVPAPRRLDIPAYPKVAQDSGVEGTVLVEVSLNEVGEIIGSRLVRSVPILDEAALDAVRNWHYEPTTVDGHGVPVKFMVTVSFSLRR